MKVAIASGKGGTGKTTLATNLALSMARTGPVVLVDLDVEAPNSGLFIRGGIRHEETVDKLVPGWTPETCRLCGHCQAVCNFNAIVKLGDSVLVLPELCHGCHACSELCPTGSLPMQPGPMGELKHFRAGRLDFVESRLLIGEEQAVPLIRRTIDYVDAHFPADVVRLFDSPPGTSCPVVEATRGADLVILVTEPTPFGLHDLKLAVQTMRLLGRDFVVVLNRYGIGDDRVERYCADEGIELEARIPHSRRIASACAAGRLFPGGMPAVRAALQDIDDLIRVRRGGGRP